MDFPIFEEDSCFNEMLRTAEWLKDSTPIDLIELDQNDSDPNCMDDRSIPFTKLKTEEPFNDDQRGTQSSIQ